MNKPKNKSKSNPLATLQHQKAKNQIQIQHVSYASPVPPPEIIDYYERIFPGAAKYIFETSEKQLIHRLKLEEKVIKSDIRNSFFGLIFAFIIGFSGIFGGVYCIIKGYSIQGSILGGTSVGSLAIAFIYGSRQRRIERENKYKELNKK